MSNSAIDHTATRVFVGAAWVLASALRPVVVALAPHQLEAETETETETETDIETESEDDETVLVNREHDLSVGTVRGQYIRELKAVVEPQRRGEDRVRSQVYQPLAGKPRSDAKLGGVEFVRGDGVERSEKARQLWRKESPAAVAVCTSASGARHASPVTPLTSSLSMNRRSSIERGQSAVTTGSQLTGQPQCKSIETSSPARPQPKAKEKTQTQSRSVTYGAWPYLTGDPRPSWR